MEKKDKPISEKRRAAAAERFRRRGPQVSGIGLMLKKTYAELEVPVIGSDEGLTVARVLITEMIHEYATKASIRAFVVGQEPSQKLLPKASWDKEGLTRFVTAAKNGYVAVVPNLYKSRTKYRLVVFLRTEDRGVIPVSVGNLAESTFDMTKLSPAAAVETTLQEVDSVLERLV